MSTPKHPMQPTITDEHGTVRFHGNAIVRYLLDNGAIGLNALAALSFPQNDWEQFAQLIGYSLSGYGELSYVSDDTYGIVSTMAKSGITEEQATIAVLQNKLDAVRVALKTLVPTVFRVHPDDLQP